MDMQDTLGASGGRDLSTNEIVIDTKQGGSTVADPTRHSSGTLRRAKANGTGSVALPSPKKRASQRDRASVRRTYRALPRVTAGGNRSPFYRGVKRLVDIVGALALLSVLLPVLVLTWFVLLVTTRGRPIFCQERIGLCGRPFPCLKFRTMVVGADRLRHLVENEQEGPVFKNRQDPRITRVGAFLRKTSIDEMPQLLNVLWGSMSLVGPRPPIASEVEEYEEWQLRRLSVKPGLTCLWQVSGRCQVGFDKWMHMDLWYVEHQSLWTDAMLLLRTPWAVFTCRGAC